jgi:hypothetical protein
MYDTVLGDGGYPAWVFGVERQTDLWTHEEPGSFERGAVVLSDEGSERIEGHCDIAKE